MDEPPAVPFETFKKSRIEWYKRFEPQDQLRDTPPVATGKVHRLRLEAQASTQLWLGIFQTQHEDTKAAMARAFREYEAQEGRLPHMEGAATQDRYRATASFNSTHAPITFVSAQDVTSHASSSKD